MTEEYYICRYCGEESYLAKYPETPYCGTCELGIKIIAEEMEDDPDGEEETR